MNEICDNCVFGFICSLEDPEIDEDTGVCVDYLPCDFEVLFG